LDENFATDALHRMVSSIDHKSEITKELVEYDTSTHLFSEFYNGAQLFDNRLGNFRELVILLLNFVEETKVVVAVLL
jgi:hypothetical protein